MAQKSKELYSISADTLYQFDFSGGSHSSDQFSGYKLALGTPFFLGIGMSNYKTTTVGLGPGGKEADVEYTMTDITIRLWKFIKDFVSVGTGFGKVTVTPKSLIGIYREEVYDVEEELAFGNGSARQFFANFGFTFDLFRRPMEVHYGVNYVYASVPAKRVKISRFAGTSNTESTDENISLNAQIHTVGIKFFF